LGKRARKGKPLSAKLKAEDLAPRTTGEDGAKAG
jgi:hypothetical protein